MQALGGRVQQVHVPYMPQLSGKAGEESWKKKDEGRGRKRKRKRKRKPCAFPKQGGLAPNPFEFEELENPKFLVEGTVKIIIMVSDIVVAIIIILLLSSLL